MVGLQEAKRNLACALARLHVDELARRLRARGADAAVARADAVMSDTYTFTKPWDMERCAVPYTLDRYDWNVVMNGDEEWCFMLNRMDYLADLAVAALVTGQRAYAEKAVSLMVDWTRAHPVIKPELSTRTLDTGIRLLSMAQSLSVFVYLGAFSDDELAFVLDGIERQMTSLPERYLPKYETSNWGSIQTASIVAATCLLRDDPEADGTYRWARERLASQMCAQVYPDGVDWELSTMYHIEVLLYALRAIYALEGRGLIAPDGLRGAAVGLAHALLAQRLPDGTIDAEGDSDRCRVTGVLALAAAVLGDGALKAGARSVELDVADLFEYGCAVEDAYHALAPADPDPRSFDGVDAGLFVARSSWGVDANQMVFLNGPLGSGHGHADNLHVSAVWRGHPVFIDAGRFTYREDSPDRPRLKAAPAHNVPLVDGLSCSVPVGSWGYEGFVTPLKTYVRHDGAAHYYEGAVVGQDPLQVLVRKLVFLDPGIWLVCDEVWCDGSHELLQRFHLDPELAAQVEEPSAHDAGASWLIPCGEGMLRLVTSGEGSVVRDTCSLDYNKLSEQDVVEASMAFMGKGSALAWLCAKDVRVGEVSVCRGFEEPVDPALAQAVRFSLPGGEAYTVAFFHGEVFSGVKAFTCEGVSFHAKTVLIRTSPAGKKQLLVLRA